MSIISGSSRFFYHSLHNLYSYGSHVQLAVLAAFFLEIIILWPSLPPQVMSLAILSHLGLTSLYIIVIIYANRGPSLRINKTYRFLFLIIICQALQWGGSIFFYNNGTLLIFTVHLFFLFTTCLILTFYLSVIPKLAYCVWLITLGPMLYILLFRTAIDTAPLAYSLLSLTVLSGVMIFFHSRARHSAIRKRLQDQHRISLLTRQLHTDTQLAKSLSAVSVLNDFKIELQKFTAQKTSTGMASYDAIWNTILYLTDQSQLQNNWQNCFSGKLSSLCQPLEADRIYIVIADQEERKVSLQQQKKYQASIDHSWILTNSICLALLTEGQIVHNNTRQVSARELEDLKYLGIQTFVDIPIMLKNKLWGVIGMDKLTSSKAFTPQQLKGLQFIANILTMTIRNQQDRAERDRLVSVIEQSNDCTLITDLAGQILYSNEACEAVTGYSQTELMGTNIKALHPEGGTDHTIWQQLTTAMSKGQKWQGQFTNQRKDHTFYEEEVLLSPAYDHQGQIASQIIVKRDITEKKRLESIVEAANLMDNIGFIFSSIRHELGNPINSIKVSLSVLDSNLERYDKNNIKRFINRSLADIGRVEYLLQTLKNFSIFERPIMQKTDLTALFSNFIALIATDLNRQNIRLTANLPKTTSIGMIDPRAFQQVLLNIIANAADALSETVNKNISITLQEENSKINIIISDNGCGISDSAQANLFKPFFTTKPKGTGLGLVIVKKMLSKMNCSVDIHSKVNIGTKVIIVLAGH